MLFGKKKTKKQKEKVEKIKVNKNEKIYEDILYSVNDFIESDSLTIPNDKSHGIVEACLMAGIFVFDAIGMKYSYSMSECNEWYRKNIASRADKNIADILISIVDEIQIKINATINGLREYGMDSKEAALATQLAIALNVLFPNLVADETRSNPELLTDFIINPSEVIYNMLYKNSFYGDAEFKNNIFELAHFMIKHFNNYVLQWPQNEK